MPSEQSLLQTSGASAEFGAFNDSSRARLYLDLAKEVDDVSAARRLTVTQRGHLQWQIHRVHKRKRAINPRFLEIMYIPQQQNDDGEIT